MAEMWISMGPQHPMTHGLWTLKVKVDGETVVDTVPDLGYNQDGSGLRLSAVLIVLLLIGLFEADLGR